MRFTFGVPDHAPHRGLPLQCYDVDREPRLLLLISLQKVATPSENIRKALRAGQLAAPVQLR